MSKSQPASAVTAPDVHRRHTAADKTRSEAHRYCLVLLLLPLMAIPAFVALGRSDYFLRHGASVWVQSNDAVFDMHNRECDVLVFGDSTAMTGIDPDVVELKTGFKTCNIAVTGAVLAVTKNLTLDHFLANNAKPKVLLLQLSPDQFQKENYDALKKTIYPEGLLELLRHSSPEDARRMLLTHPPEAVTFAGYAAGYSAYYAIKDVWFRTTHIRPEEDQVQVRNGFFTPLAPARQYCEASAPISDPSGGAYSRQLVSNFQSHYTEQSGVVLVNVAPIPSCDQNFAAYSAELNGVTSNSLLSLPIGLFNDRRHYTAIGSQVVSILVAKELNALVAKELIAVANRYPMIDDRVPAAYAAPTLQRIGLQQ